MSICAQGQTYVAGICSGTHSLLKWDSTTSTASAVAIGTSSVNNGMANTDLLMARSAFPVPFPAAASCRAKGASWFLPATTQLTAALAATGGRFSTDYAWMSTERSDAPASHAVVRYDNRMVTDQKYNEQVVYCARSV